MEQESNDLTLQQKLDAFLPNTSLRRLAWTAGITRIKPEALNHLKLEMYNHLQLIMKYIYTIVSSTRHRTIQLEDISFVLKTLNERSYAIYLIDDYERDSYASIPNKKTKFRNDLAKIKYFRSLYPRYHFMLKSTFNNMLNDLMVTEFQDLRITSDCRMFLQSYVETKLIEIFSDIVQMKNDLHTNITVEVYDVKAILNLTNKLQKYIHNHPIPFSYPPPPTSTENEMNENTKGT